MAYIDPFTTYDTWYDPPRGEGLSDAVQWLKKISHAVKRFWKKKVTQTPQKLTNGNPNNGTWKMYLPSNMTIFSIYLEFRGCVCMCICMYVCIYIYMCIQFVSCQNTVTVHNEG